MSYHSVQQYRRSSSDNTVNRLDFPATNGLQQTSRRRPQHQSFRLQDASERQAEPKPPPVQGQKAPVEKLQVQAPFSVLQFFASAVLFVCKLYLHIPTSLKVAVYLVCVFLLSAAGDLLRPVRRLYLSRPDNLVTLWLVHFSNFWTFSLLSGYVAFTSFLYSGGKRRAVLRNGCRMAVAAVLSLSIKHVFAIISLFSGFCSNEELAKEKACLREGHRWLSFQASEEVFFLIHHALIIMEEVGNFPRWESLDFALQKDSWNALLAPQQTAKNVVFAKKTYAQYGVTVKFLFFLLTVLCVVWDVMLIMTAFFYQNLPQKLVGSLSACLVWFVTYHLWYPHGWPGLPDIGIFRQMPKAAKK
jgi:hypothetical protein